MSDSNNQNSFDPYTPKQNKQQVYRPKKLTTDEIREGCVYLTGKEESDETRVCVINEEFRQAFDFLDQFEKSVTFFGSARIDEANEHYQQARRLGKRIVEEVGCAIVTGGGPGIMEAGNRGAKDGSGQSVGLTIDLPKEQETNPYVDSELSFYFFFSRKVALTYAAEAYIYFPGGYGTLDEIFEILTLVQTGKIAKVPIILVGTDYWNPLDDFIQKQLLETHNAINFTDTDLYTITDNEDEVLRIVTEAPIRQGD